MSKRKNFAKNWMQEKSECQSPTEFPQWALKEQTFNAVMFLFLHSRFLVVTGIHSMTELKAYKTMVFNSRSLYFHINIDEFAIDRWIHTELGHHKFAFLVISIP